MTPDEKMKWVCTFLLMAFTGWWGYFTVQVTLGALQTSTGVDILKVAGASGLLGTLTTLLTLSIQFWFRRAKVEHGTKEESPH